MMICVVSIGDATGRFQLVQILRIAEADGKGVDG